MSAALMPPPASPPAGLLARLRRFSVAEYHDMLRRGIIREQENVELLEGCLVRGEEMNPPHSSTLNLLRRALTPRLPAAWDNRVQDAVTLSDSEPLPDYAVMRYRADAYATRHPGPGDIGLLVEVADSSLADDRVDKQRMYARAGIVEYWIVNIPDRQIEVYTDPDPTAEPPAYRSRADFRPGDAVPVTLDGAAAGTVAVGDVLP